MSRWNRRITALLAVLLICTLSACGQSQIPLDYGDETAFEADLNAGKNLVGKTVSFVAAELHPQSLYGYGGRSDCYGESDCGGERYRFLVY